MRRLIDEAVTDYDERTLTSTLAPLPDLKIAARAVYDAVAGYGPLQRHLDDPTIEEIWIYERLTVGSFEGWRSRGSAGRALVRRARTPHNRRDRTRTADGLRSSTS